MSDMRAEWTRIRNEIDTDAIDSKDSQAAVVELSDRYRALSPNERRVVDSVLCDWMLSDDERLRFDALALISEHLILSALPRLRTLSDRLSRESGPGPKYERAKVGRIIARLSEFSLG